MLGRHFRDDLRVKELATGLTLVGVEGVGWNEDDPTRDMDPLPAGLSAAQVQAYTDVVAAHVYRAPVIPADVAGFVAWILTRFNFGRQRVLRADQGNFYDYIRDGNWDGVRWCITDSYMRNVLTPPEYIDFQAAWVTYHLPGATP